MKTSPDDPVLFEKTGFIAAITLNNPPHNPLGLAAIDRLEELFTELASDESVRAVVLTSAGDLTFSVGANIKENESPCFAASNRKGNYGMPDGIGTAVLAPGGSIDLNPHPDQTLRRQRARHFRRVSQVDSWRFDK